jgi:hypothetical protein
MSNRLAQKKATSPSSTNGISKTFYTATLPTVDAIYTFKVTARTLIGLNQTHLNLIPDQQPIQVHPTVAPSTRLKT